MGGVADPRPGSPARAIAGGDSIVHPWPVRRSRRAARLPGGGGRGRPAADPPAVSDADVNPPDRDAGAGTGRDCPDGDRGPVAHARVRATWAAWPTAKPPVDGSALPPARSRVPRGTAAPRGRVDRRRRHPQQPRPPGGVARLT